MGNFSVSRNKQMIGLLDQCVIVYRELNWNFEGLILLLGEWVTLEKCDFGQFYVLSLPPLCPTSYK